MVFIVLSIFKAYNKLKWVCCSTLQNNVLVWNWCTWSTTDCRGGHFVLLLCRETFQLMEKHILKIRLLPFKKILLIYFFLWIQQANENNNKSIMTNPLEKITWSYTGDFTFQHVAWLLLTDTVRIPLVIKDREMEHIKCKGESFCFVSSLDLVVYAYMNQSPWSQGLQDH